MQIAYPFSHVCPTPNIPSELMNSPRPTKLYTLNKIHLDFSSSFDYKILLFPPRFAKTFRKVYISY